MADCPVRVQKPKWEKPPPPQALGVVQLLIRGVELDTSETCFLLLRCGAQWGRSITLPSSKTHHFNWEVRSPDSSNFGILVS